MLSKFENNTLQPFFFCQTNVVKQFKKDKLKNYFLQQTIPLWLIKTSLIDSKVFFFQHRT